MSEYNENHQYSNEDFAYQNVNKSGKPKTLGWSLASMIVGILAVVCCCLGWSGLIFGLIAVGFAILARTQLGYFDGMAIAGLILGIFGFVFGGFMLILAYCVPADLWESYIDEFYAGFESTKS